MEANYETTNVLLVDSDALYCSFQVSSEAELVRRVGDEIISPSSKVYLHGFRSTCNQHNLSPLNFDEIRTVVFTAHDMAEDMCRSLSVDVTGITAPASSVLALEALCARLINAGHDSGRPHLVAQRFIEDALQEL